MNGKCNLETLQKKTIHNFMNEMQKKTIAKEITNHDIFRDLGKKKKREFYIYSINKIIN